MHVDIEIDPEKTAMDIVISDNLLNLFSVKYFYFSMTNFKVDIDVYINT